MGQAQRVQAEKVLDELMEVARRCGLEVRQERILREIGYRARSGACRLKHRNVIILDRDQSVAEQIELLADVLRAVSTDTMYLSPAARRLIESEAPGA